MLEGKLLPMLYVHDLVRSVEFYRDVLGFEFAGWWDESKRSFVTDPPADTPSSSQATWCCISTLRDRRCRSARVGCCTCA